MSKFFEILIPVFYLIVVTIHAAIDWYQIKKLNRIINHKKESYYYAALCFILFWFFLITTNIHAHVLIVFPLAVRVTFFDPLLNWFCGKSFLYEAVDKPDSQKSVWDKFEELTHIPIIVFRIGYFITLIIYSFYYYLIVYG